jgi:glycosyltransferase involved in cell wall biosynthesis
MRTDPVLLVLSPGFARDESDDSCLTSQQQLIRSFNALYPGIKIIILAFQYPFVKKKYEWYGNTVIAFNGRNSGGIFRRWIWRQVRLELNNLGKTHLIKGLLSFWCGEAALMASRFARLHRLPHFCWILGQDAKAGNTFIRSIQPTADELVAISDFVADTFEKNYHTRPAHVIPNGVDPARFSGETGERNIDMIAVGSLIPLKRFSMVVDTVAKLKDRFHGIRVMIIGEGGERKMLQEKISDTGLDNNITLTGALDHTSVITLLQRSKILLHPSSYEGFATVALEALYAGCTVISSVQPMHNAVPNWFIAGNAEEMAQRVAAILPVFSPIFPDSAAFDMNVSAAAFMRLYD